MKNRLMMLIVALVCGAWVIFPDALPIVIDDVAAALIGSAAILKFIKTSNAKSPA